ncbi:MAG: cysteine synthase family protein [Candidatus Fermentibacteraceae bacterium]|nr:cysteine synthase family protein [Candidatus Fermentibacteraceae bacterium]
MQNDRGILSAIGNTPVARLRYTGSRGGAEILLKLEGTNPGGSVKDRSALWMVRHAEKEGLLHRGRTIIEATSGNTGIGLAMVGAVLGYKVKLVLPENVSVERRHILQAFGARLLTTPGHLGTDGAIVVAKQIFQDNPEQYFMPDQYSNNANWLSHYESTAPEIIRQTAGTVNAFVAGIGTGGTLMGVSRRLKEFSPEIRIIGVEPEVGHCIQGLKNMKESATPAIFDRSRLDMVVSRSDSDAFAMTRALAVKEGLFVGLSGGAAVSAAVQVAAGMKPDETVVVLIADRGDRYLSTGVFGFA